MKVKNTILLICALLSQTMLFSAESEPSMMEPVVVEGKKILPFMVKTTRSATLTETPIEELPLVVDSLTQDVMQAKSNASVQDVLQMQSGIFTDGQSLLSRTSGQYSIRGLSGSETAIDGLILPGAMGSAFDSFATDRVEIVKGPVGGVAGGQMSSLGAYGAGGMVNIVMKEPQFEDKLFVEENVRFNGGFRSRSLIDYDTVNKDKTVGFRMTGSATIERPFWADSSIDVGQSYAVAPVIEWRPDDSWRITLKAAFQTLDTPGYQGIPVVGGIRVGAYDANYGGDISRNRLDGGIIQLAAEKKVNDSFTLRSGVGFGYASVDWQYYYVGTNARGLQGYRNLLNTGKGMFGYGWQDTENYTYNAFIQGFTKFSTGELKHELLTALDYSGKYNTGYSYFGTSTIPLDIYNLHVPSTFVSKVRDDSTNSYLNMCKVGFTVQDQLSWEKWRVLLGIRADESFSTEHSSTMSFSPRGGITYLFTPEWIAFANLSQTNAPNYGYLGMDGRELTSKWSATQYESGLRYSPFQDFWLSSSFFYIDQTNTPELIANTTNRYDGTGSSVSKGVEFSARGQINPALSTFLSYSWIWYRDVDAGLSFDRFPAHTLVWWLYYSVQEGWMKDVVFGAGYRLSSSYFVTERGNKIADDFQIPSFSVFDATVEIPLPQSDYYSQASVKLGIYNIFDKKYYPSSRGPTQCFPGSPRTLEVALKFDF